MIESDELLSFELMIEMSLVYRNAMEQGLDPYKEVSNQFNIERQAVKTIMLGINYNISFDKIKNVLNTNSITNRSRNKSQAL